MLAVSRGGRELEDLRKSGACAGNGDVERNNRSGCLQFLPVVRAWFVALSREGTASVLMLLHSLGSKRLIQDIVSTRQST